MMMAVMMTVAMMMTMVTMTTIMVVSIPQYRAPIQHQIVSQTHVTTCQQRSLALHEHCAVGDW